MQTSYFAIVFAILSSVSASEDPCPRSSINNFYREMNCEPVYENASKCPTSYNCSQFFNQDRRNCFYKNQTYAVGNVIPEHVSDPCFAQCLCRQNELRHPSFTCAYVECPNFGAPPPQNCVSLYEPGNCCPVRTHCPDEDPEITVTCKANGKVYYEGEQFYPENVPCKKCLCKKGFQGEFVEPFCEDVSCSLELVGHDGLHDGCVPVYYGEQGCCPISWKCPSAVSARTKVTKSSGVTTTYAKCQFGSMELNQHEILEEDGVKCECLVPPYLTCYGS